MDQFSLFSFTASSCTSKVSSSTSNFFKFQKCHLKRHFCPCAYLLNKQSTLKLFSFSFRKTISEVSSGFGIDFHNSLFRNYFFPNPRTTTKSQNYPQINPKPSINHLISRDSQVGGRRKRDSRGNNKQNQ